MPVTIMAEAGINHNGNLGMALRLCYEAKEAGADIVKFQTYIPEKCIRKGKDYDLLSKLALTFDDFMRISDYCREIGIEFCSTPDELDSLNFLVKECKVKRIKIGSGSLTYLPLIKAAHASGLPVLVSTGMGNFNDIQNVINVWNFLSPHNTLTLMHCVSLYPCPDHLANIRAVDMLYRMWRVPVGYSDHTVGNIAILGAVTLGARIIEKHFTLDPTDLGPDHKLSIPPSEFKQLVKEVRTLEAMLGTGDKDLSKQERAMIPIIRKDKEGYQAGIS